jgi:hypothetical protein
MDYVDVSPRRNVWVQPFLLSLRSSLTSCVAALSNFLLAGVPRRCHSRRNLLSSSTFWLISIGQSYAVSVLFSGVAFQPAHGIASLKNLAANLVSSSVYGEYLK